MHSEATDSNHVFNIAIGTTEDYETSYDLSCSVGSATKKNYNVGISIIGCDGTNAEYIYLRSSKDLTTH